MTKKHFILNLFLFLMQLTAFSQYTNEYYTKKNFSSLFDFFERENDLLKFMNIKSGETIADIGGDEGYHMGALSLIYDSITFYIEDVDAKINDAKIAKMAERYSKKRKMPQTCTFKWSLGTYKSTNLPDGIFDKIIMIASFHEFTYMDEMMQDILKKLKPNGKIYIMEAFCIDKVLYCEDKHKGYYMKEVNEIMNKHGLYQTQMSSPESGIINYANILVFEKNREKSVAFFKEVENLQTYINKTSLLNQQSIASNHGITRAIADSLVLKVNDLSKLYVNYEVWLKNIANKWIQRNDVESAINVFNVLVKLFPKTGENYFLLAEAYDKNGQSDEASKNYELACKHGYKMAQCKGE